MQAKRIGIIGNKGAFGSWFEGFFRCNGCHVNGSDAEENKTRNKEVVETSDVVVFAVSLGEMESVIRSLVPHSRPDQLWMDVSARKVGAMHAMLESQAEVVGMHPLFAPPDHPSWEGEVVAVCPSRLSIWTPWFGDFKQATQAEFISVDPGFHDHCMIYEQNMVHASLLAQAMVISSLGFGANAMNRFATKLSRKQWAVMARLFRQKPELFAEMQIGTFDSANGIRKQIAALQSVLELIQTGDKAELARRFRETKEALGQDFINEASAGFE